MGTPLRIDEELVAEAKLVGDVMDRSATSQLEHWARLGRAIESVLGLAQVLELKRSGAAVSISDALEHSVSESGRAKVLAHLSSEERPRYGSVPGRPGFVTRIEANGRKTIGRMVNRRFVPESELKK